MRAASSAAVQAIVSLALEIARELHDQNRVLAREPDEHEQPDLREHVVVAAREPHAGDRRQRGTSAR